MSAILTWYPLHSLFSLHWTAHQVIFERALLGSYLGPHADYAEMLEMARDHGVRPQVELAPVSQINAMLERVRAGKARYRVVLQMP